MADVPTHSARNGRHHMTTTQNRITILAVAPFAVVAVIAGIVSYTHIVGLGIRAHQGSIDAHLLPFAVDGLIVAGVVIVLAGYRLGWLAIGLGVAATVFANVESGLPYGKLDAAIAAWPAVAFSVASFVLERWLKTRCLTATVVTTESTTGPADTVTMESTTATVPAVTTPPAHTDATHGEDMAPAVAASVVTIEDTTEPAPEPAPVVTTPRRRPIRADASDEHLAALVLDHAGDPFTLTPYRVNKILGDHGGKKKLGDPRAKRVIALAQRQYRARTVVAIGERR